MVKQPRVRAVKDWGIEPLDIVDLNNMINDWGVRFNAEMGSYAEISNDGREGDTWFITFAITDPDAPYTTFIQMFFRTLYQGVNEYRKGIASIAPMNNPKVYFTPQNLGSDEYEFKFTMAVFERIPTKLSEIVNKGFILTVTDGVGVDYYLDIYFD